MLACGRALILRSSLQRLPGPHRARRPLARLSQGRAYFVLDKAFNIDPRMGAVEILPETFEETAGRSVYHCQP